MKTSSTKTSRTGTDPQFQLRAQAVIDRAALRHNLARVRELAPGRIVCAVVKANGYGHGAVTVAHSLPDADLFAVSNMNEALELRRSGITRPIIVLSHGLDENACRIMAENNINPVVFDQIHLDLLEAFMGPTLSVWIMLDSGMHRLGLPPEQAGDIEKRLSRLSHVERLGWTTHLACADEAGSAQTQSQIETFLAATQGLGGQRSIANSAGVTQWPGAHEDLVRPGIMLYGCSPMVGGMAAGHDLQPVMTLTAPIISRRRVAKGTPIGYGATWHAPEDMEVGVIGIGYGDGYPRHAPSGTPVLVRGQRAPLIGRVSMDMIVVDLRDVPSAAVGDRVVLWGAGLPAEEIAVAAETIPHELFCQLTPRVDFKVV